jgi:sugar (pentulose or hexulose) kinase
VSAQEEADLVGNSCVGFYGLDEYQSLAAASEALVRFERVYQPASTHRQLYDDRYAVFRGACVGLAETFRGLYPVPECRPQAHAVDALGAVRQVDPLVRHRLV